MVSPAKVQVVEFDGPICDDGYPSLSYTVACSKCGEQGNYETYQEAYTDASNHYGEHLEQEG